MADDKADGQRQGERFTTSMEGRKEQLRALREDDQSSEFNKRFRNAPAFRHAFMQQARVDKHVVPPEDFDELASIAMSLLNPTP